jgi:cell pole-organizing protein PopZ
MEEILASIRRIIAEDGETTARAGGATIDQERQDILELTDRIEADGSVVSISARKARDSQPFSRETPEPLKPENGRIISEAAAAAAMASLTELAKEAPHVKVGPVPTENKAVEDMTREMMKPLLKSWLDSNLPEIIERVVRDEIARLAREAQQR